MAVSSSNNLPHNLVGFVTDPVSKQVILTFIKDSNIGYAEVIDGSSDEAIEYLKNNRSPKTIIVDISNSELPMSDLGKIIDSGVPSMNIITIGSKNDVGLFRDLMSLGVSDYLVKPINTTLLKKAIDDASSEKKFETHEKTGKLIYFTNSVGGAGATTTSINIGWILANRHFKQTMLMDLDFLFGAVHLMLDIKAENSYLNMLESPEKIDGYFIETIIKRYDKRLFYLGGLEDLARETEFNLAAFGALINSIKKQFNYVLMDAPRNVSGINNVAMKKADTIVFMVEMSITSAQNTARFLEFLASEQSTSRIVIIANKVGLSSAGALTNASFENVIDRKIDYMMPLDEGVALAAANIGQPLAISSNPLTDVLESITIDLVGKKDLKQLTEELQEQEVSPLEKIKSTVLGWIGSSSAK
ncbi:fimbriae assembly protein [Alphaproteobacteria bacterium]|nr:fimbriae assembly protein [Alphaproteobacteria bacterium]